MPDFQHDLAALDRVFNQPGPVAQTPADWNRVAAEREQAEALAREHRAKAQEEAEKRADELLIRQVGQETGGDPEQMVARLRAVNPKAAMKFETEWEDVRKKTIDRAKGENELETKQLERNLGRLAAARADPTLYGVVRRQILADEPEMAEILPEQFEPTRIDAALQFGRTAAQIADYDAKSLEYLVKGDYHQAVGMAFADPTMDAQEVAQAAAGLIAMKVPRRIVDSYGWQQWTPDFAAKALERSRTPEQRADAAAAAGVQERIAGHQQVMEEQGERRIEIAERTAQRLAAGGGSDNSPLQAIIGPDGQPILVRRADALGQRPATATMGTEGKPSTGAEKTALGFFNRARQADGDLQAVEPAIAGKGYAGQAYMEYAPNMAQSGTVQAYQQAQRAFTEARLRKESGAAIAQSEYDNDRRIYFAQPGDSAATLEQKRRARAGVLAGLGFQAGRALREFYGEDADSLVGEYRTRASKDGQAPKATSTTGGGAAKPRYKFDPKTGALVEQK